MPDGVAHVMGFDVAHLRGVPHLVFLKQKR